MQIFVSHKGERSGPFSLFRVSELLDEGKLLPDDLGWHQGRDEWTPLREIPALMSTIESKRERDFQRESSKPLDTSATPTSERAKADTGSPRSAKELRSAAAASVATEGVGSGNQVRPFSRFWARVFDYLLVMLTIYSIFGAPPMPGGTAPTFSDLVDPEFLDRLRETMDSPQGRRLANIQSAALVIWVLLEGLMLRHFGATPGKALFGIRVVQRNGSRLSMQQSLMRALFVWFAGVGFWMPPLTLATMAFGFYYLLSRRTTLWDRQVGSRVAHRPFTALRILLVVFAFLAILLAQQSLTFR